MPPLCFQVLKGKLKSIHRTTVISCFRKITKVNKTLFQETFGSEVALRPMWHSECIFNMYSHFINDTVIFSLK